MIDVRVGFCHYEFEISSLNLMLRRTFAKFQLSLIELDHL